MSPNAGNGRETEVGDAGSPVLVDQDVRLYGQVRDVELFNSRESRTPFRSP